MSNYTKSTNFASKDTLPSGNASKIVKGTEIDTEFNAIASAISSKADTASPTFTGTPSAPTASLGTNTTQLATTSFVVAEVAAASGSAVTASSITTALGYTPHKVTGATFTITLANPGVCTSTYAIPNGTAIVLETTGALPTGITTNTIYYAINSNTSAGSTTFNLALTSGGAAINTSGTQSGVHTLYNTTRYAERLTSPVVEQTFSAYANADQALSTSAATRVSLQAEDWDTNSRFNNTSATVDSIPAYAFMPSVAGYYQINMTIRFNVGTSATSGVAAIALYKNGSAVYQGEDNNITGASGEMSCSASLLVYFNGRTDYVQLYGGLTTNGTSYGFKYGTVAATSRFQAAFIRA